MKAKSLFTILLIVGMGFMLSCVSMPVETLDPQILVGTKWVPIEPSPGITFSLEFEDNRFCLHSFMDSLVRLEYRIVGNRIDLANHTSYIYDGDTLLSIGAFSVKPFLTRE